MNKHFCLLPRLGDSRDRVVMAKNNCSPVTAAARICEIALLARSSEVLDGLSLFVGRQLPNSGCPQFPALADITGLSQLCSYSWLCRSREKGTTEICGNGYTGSHHCSSSPLSVSSVQAMSRLLGKIIKTCVRS